MQIKANNQIYLKAKLRKMSFNSSLKSVQLMSLCCELPKVTHSRDKVQLTGTMHDRQELDGS